MKPNKDECTVSSKKLLYFKLLSKTLNWGELKKFLFYKWPKNQNMCDIIVPVITHGEKIISQLETATWRTPRPLQSW